MLIYCIIFSQRVIVDSHQFSDCRWVQRYLFIIFFSLILLVGNNSLGFDVAYCCYNWHFWLGLGNAYMEGDLLLLTSWAWDSALIGRRDRSTTASKPLPRRLSTRRLQLRIHRWLSGMFGGTNWKVVIAGLFHPKFFTVSFLGGRRRFLILRRAH